MPAFASPVCVPAGITGSAVGIIICATAVTTKKYKSVINES